MKKLFLFFILLFLLAGFLMPVADAHAFSLMEEVGRGCIDSGNCTFCDILRVIHNVGRFIFISMAGVAFILFMWAGTGLIFNWGSTETIAANKKLIFHTLLAIVIILAAYTLVNILLHVLSDTPLTTEYTFNRKAWWQGPTCQ